MHFKLGLSGYDACYATLARDLKGIWLTFDEQAHSLIQKENISCVLDERMPRAGPVRSNYRNLTYFNQGGYIK